MDSQKHTGPGVRADGDRLSSRITFAAGFEKVLETGNLIDQ
jgi:hypothetical protein